MTKEEYKKLYEEYKELKVKIDNVFKVRSVVPGKKLEFRTAPGMEEMSRYNKLIKILEAKEAKDFLDLNPGEWYEIYHG